MKQPVEASRQFDRWVLDPAAPSAVLYSAEDVAVPAVGPTAQACLPFLRPRHRYALRAAEH